jgi:hypothetical protein
MEMGVVTNSATVAGKVAATGTVEVTVKEPKQISTGLVRMSAILVRK